MAPARPSREREAGMQVVVAVLQVGISSLAVLVGALLCYVELFGAPSDWGSAVVGVVMLLVGVGGVWAGLNRAVRAVRGSRPGPSSRSSAPGRTARGPGSTS